MRFETGQGGATQTKWSWGGNENFAAFVPLSSLRFETRNQ
jgi:hypothetical protein